jgi:hypothetical protein
VNNLESAEKRMPCMSTISSSRSSLGGFKRLLGHGRVGASSLCEEVGGVDAFADRRRRSAVDLGD